MTPYHATPDATFFVGDCRDVLKALEPESINLACTSPPYFSLRKYQGVEPAVWDATDPDCAHDWADWQESDDTREDTISGKSRTTERFYGSPSRRFDGNHQKHAGSSICRLCGAMLCCLGLEPTPDAYIRHLVEVFRAVKRVLRRDGLLFVNLGSSFSSSGKGPTGANGIGNQETRQDFVGGRKERYHRSQSGNMATDTTNGLLELRPDLTDEERAYVLSELAKCNSL